MRVEYSPGILWAGLYSVSRATRRWRLPEIDDPIQVVPFPTAEGLSRRPLIRPLPDTLGNLDGDGEKFLQRLETANNLMARWNRVHQLPYLFFRLQDRIRQLRNHGTISDWLDFAYGSPFPPGQIRAEISAFITLVARRKPQTVLEIGAGEGGTLMLLAMAAAPEATIISVDLPHGAFGGGYPLWKAIYFRQFAIPSQRMHLLRVNSHVPTTVQRVRGILADRMLDVLFIDGDHTYRGVKADWEMYGPLVAREGLVGFHDIVQHPPETGCEVHTFWRELKVRHAHVEIVADHEQAWGGIGVIETGGIGSD